MARIDCACESEVVTLVYSGQWPQRASETLRAHVAACPVCADVVTVAAAIDTEAEADAESAGVLAQRLPTSGTMWWRAQMRARQEAAREAARPITVAQAVGFAAGVGAIGLFLGASSTWVQRGVASIGSAFGQTFARIDLPSLAGALSAESPNPGALLLLAGLAVAVTSLVVAVVVIRQE